MYDRSSGGCAVFIVACAMAALTPLLTVLTVR